MFIFLENDKACPKGEVKYRLYVFCSFLDLHSLGFHPCVSEAAFNGNVL